MVVLEHVERLDYKSKLYMYESIDPICWQICNLSNYLKSLNDSFEELLTYFVWLFGTLNHMSQ